MTPDFCTWRRIHFAFVILSAASACQPPDAPVGGSYVPVKKKYLFGDKVAYACKSGFIRLGKESRICEFNGKWSEQMPFCDTPTKVKNPVASSVAYSLQNANKAIDGDPATCFSSKKGTGENFKIYLNDLAVVNLIRMFLPKGTVKIEIFTMRARIKRNCSYYDRELEENQWVLVQCEDNQTADSIHIQDISASQNVLQICEVEVYAKEGSWCRDPPDVFIPNGWLQVSHEKATLQCAEGFRGSENVRLVCDKNERWTGLLQCEEILCGFTFVNGTVGGEWRVLGTGNKISVGTVKRLTCHRDYKMLGGPDTVRCRMDGTWTSTTASCTETKSEKGSSGIRSTIIIMSVIVVLLIFACFGLMLFLILKKKPKPHVVILKTDDNVYTVQSCSSGGTAAYAESEYSTIAYEAAPFRGIAASPRPPQTRPPVNLLDAYSQPTDQWSLVDYAKTQPAPAYAEPQQQSSFATGTPENKSTVDIVLFDSLKSSSLYGT